MTNLIKLFLTHLGLTLSLNARSLLRTIRTMTKSLSFEIQRKNSSSKKNRKELSLLRKERSKKVDLKLLLKMINLLFLNLEELLLLRKKKRTRKGKEITKLKIFNKSSKFNHLYKFED